VAPWQRWPAPFAPSGPRAELASWGDAGECISGSCMDRIAATRARSTFPQRRPAGCRLRPGAGWPGWMGSERSGWKLLPSEVIYHVCGRLRGPARSGALQEQQHQGRLLLLRLLGQAGGAGCLPPSAVWGVYARVRHPKAAFATVSSDVPRRVSCFGPEPAAVLPARPPADQQGSLGRQEHSRPCDAAWAALLPALRIGASACDM
jgi:hypothetical protein